MKGEQNVFGILVKHRFQLNDYHGQHDTSYYQPQPANNNKCQQYLHDRKTQQAPYIKRGIIHSGITSPEKKSPIIPLGNEPYYRNKNPTVSSDTSLKTETRNIHQLRSQMKLPSKDKESTPSSTDIASSWVSTEVYHTDAINPRATK